MYRYEYKRWQFFARSGIGSCNVDRAPDLIHYNDESDDPADPYDDIIYAERVTCPFYVNFGITGGYRLSRVFSLILDVNYHYPFTSSKVKISHEVNSSDGYHPEIADIRSYHSRSWGNNLTIS